MKTTLDFLDQVAQFRHSEFLHRLDLQQTRNIAREAMELYADYKNKDLLQQIAIHEQRIVILRQLLDKAGLSELSGTTTQKPCPNCDGSGFLGSQHLDFPCLKCRDTTLNIGDTGNSL